MALMTSGNRNDLIVELEAIFRRYGMPADHSEAEKLRKELRGVIERKGHEATEAAIEKLRLIADGTDTYWRE
jgi:hypothetical protein